MNTTLSDGRVLGRISGAAPGPTLICVAGIHGNEPAGVAALRRVTQALQAITGVARGDYVALTGNLAALAREERFLDRDLNRDWRSLHPPEHTRRITESSEDREQRELATELRKAIDAARGDAYLIDLHTTSGHGRPFTVIADSLLSRRFALSLPSPLVLGLEEHLDGTLVDCVTGAGHAAIAFEGGKTEEPSSIDNLESAILTALEVTNIIDSKATANGGRGGASSGRANLHRASDGLPKIVEMRYHHAIEPADGFTMNEGWSGFDRIKRGEKLGSDVAGDVVAPEDGYLLMPLYQRQGEEGFYVVQEVR